MYDNENLAKLFLRLSIGGLMLPHGIAKLSSGTAGIANMLEQFGLPGFIAYGAIVGEVLAPVLMIIGVKTRASALLIAGTMVMSVVLAYRDRLLTLNEYGGWIVELNMLFLFGSMAIYFLGAGKYAVSKKQSYLD
jgi:putative oxidoreductase